jgi:hypothetical protein
VFPVDIDQSINKAREEFSISALRLNSHDLGAFHPFGAQHPSQDLHRVGPEVFGDIFRISKARHRLFQHGAADEHLNFG